MFVQAIPFQIYAILAIIMIPLVAFTKLDFSQMKKAELRAGKSNETFSFMQEDEEKGSAETGYSRKNAKPVMVDDLLQQRMEELVRYMNI